MNKATINILNKALEHDFSDLIISPMNPLKIEKHGKLIELDTNFAGNKKYLSPFVYASLSLCLSVSLCVSVSQNAEHNQI